MKEKIIKTLYGTTNVPSYVVFTPISKMFDGLFCSLSDTESTRGWWKNASGRTDYGKRMMIVHTPTSNSIIDPIISLNHKKIYLIHLGYCGGLSNSLNIGDIIAPSESYSLPEKVLYRPKHMTNFSPEVLKSVNSSVFGGRNLTVDSFLREHDSFPNLLPNTVSVDQETVHVYRDSANPSLSVMIVSDLPLSKPFFEIDESDIEKINGGSQKAVYAIISLINSLDEEDLLKD